MPGSNKYSRDPNDDNKQDLAYQKAETKNENVNSTSISQQPSATPVEAAKLSNSTPNSNQELIDLLERQVKDHPLETPEQRKKREKQEKWEGIINGISDAASAISNLVFATKGAPNMYDGRNGLSAASQARFDKAKAEREQLLREHLNYAMSIGRLKDADMKWRRQLEQDRIAAAQREHDNAIADAKELRASALSQLQQDLEKHKINAAQSDARRKKIEADYAEAYEKARVNRENASAGASNARANHYNRGGSGRDSYDRDFYDIQTERLFDMLTDEEKEAVQNITYDNSYNKHITYDKKTAIGRRIKKDPVFAKLVKAAYSRQNPDGGEKAKKKNGGSLLPGSRGGNGSLLPK